MARESLMTFSLSSLFRHLLFLHQFPPTPPNESVHHVIKLSSSILIPIFLHPTTSLMSFLVFRVPPFHLLFLRTLNRHQSCHVRYVVLFFLLCLFFLAPLPHRKSRWVF
ncbi:hypothetical protein ABZX51_011438 [Aspergillus tubingensis]